jgi:hypothetical protein
MFQRIGTILGELFCIGGGVFLLVFAYRGRRKDGGALSASSVKTFKICGAGIIICYGFILAMRLLGQI